MSGMSEVYVVVRSDKDMTSSARVEEGRVRDVSADGTHEGVQHVLVSCEELRVNPHGYPLSNNIRGMM